MSVGVQLRLYWATVGLTAILLRGLSATLRVLKAIGLSQIIAPGLLKLAETWRIRGEKPWTSSPPAKSEDQVIWIHAASGEFEYAKPVIRELQKQRPELKFLVTYFSPTYRRQVENFPGITWSFALPFDSPWVWEKFVAHFRPQALLISRTDVWPGMIHRLSEAKVPMLLFSSTFGPATARLHRPARRLTLHALKQIDEIQVVDEADKKYLLSAAAKIPDPVSQLEPWRVRVAGDTRYDQVLARLASPKALPPAWRQSRSWIVGSAWAEDLEVIGPAWASMRGERPRLVIVPHEPSSQFCRAIVAQARSSWGAQHVALASDIRDLPHVDLDVLVVDQVGFLAELYRDAWIATVGGSFRRSVHSVMEALAAGVFCVLGPHHRNNREALDFQHVFAPGELHELHDLQQAAIEVVTNSEDCRASVEKLMNQLGHHPHWRDWLIAEVNSRTGATQAVLEWLIKKLS